MKRIGFIVNSRRPEWQAMKRGMRPWHGLTGWPDTGSPMYFMRFAWVADEVNRMAGGSLRYELFKPWRKYDAVVFLKSMDHGCADFATVLRSRNTRIIFEANVDYYSECSSGTLPAELVPAPAQRDRAIRMTAGADAVVASSRRLAEICRRWNGQAAWVPDNILSRLVPAPAASAADTPGPLPVWWSGMPAKTTDLLLIDEVLRTRRQQIHLHLVTGDLGAAMARWPREQATRLRGLLAEVPHTVHQFRSAAELLQLYGRAPGVIISPRFLDNPYNESHSEWKITLGLACGLTALASPQPSYLDVADRCSHSRAVIICRTEQDWGAALEEVLSGHDRAEASEAAREVVRRYYSTEVVARQHADLVLAALDEAP